jgi:hypothetical protein
MGLLTSGIYGPPGTISSRSAVLQSSLESRLRARVQTLGSTLFTLTWKDWATPSGVFRSRLRASVPRTSETETTGWPTPMAGTPAQNGNNPAGNTDSSRRTVALVSPWATPAARDWRSESATDEFNAKRWGHSRGKPLSAQATLAHWHTPVVRDHRNSGGGGSNPRDLPRQASGATPTGSVAETAKPAPLNPAHSRWLMGYPPAWDDCAVTAMQSFPSRRRSSSKRSPKQAA